MVLNSSKKRKATEMFLYGFLLHVVCVYMCKCINIMGLNIEWDFWT